MKSGATEGMRLARPLLVLLVLLVGGLARAQSAANEPEPAPLRPAPEDRAEVERYLKLGTGYFQSRHYMQAAEALNQAYRLEPRPLFLFNLGQAYRRAERPRRALEMYQRFLQADPQTRMRVEAEGHIRDLKVLITVEDRAEQERQALAAARQRAEERLQQEQQRAERDRQALLAERARAERERRRPFYRRGWFWGVVAGVGVAGVAIGLAVGLTQRDPQTDGGIVSLHF